MERCGKRKARNSLSDRGPGIGVVAGFLAMGLPLEGPHVWHVGVNQRVKVLHMLQEVESICKTRNHLSGSTNSRVPALHGPSPVSPLRRTLPPPSRLRPMARGHRVYGLPCSSDFALGRGGLRQWLSVSLSPCRRSHPAGVGEPYPPVYGSPGCLRLHGGRRGLRAAHGRGHRCVRLRDGLATRPHPADEAVERLQKVGFPSPCSPSYRALVFPLGGFSPPEHASLRWTHHRA